MQKYNWPDQVDHPKDKVGTGPEIHARPWSLSSRPGTGLVFIIPRRRAEIPESANPSHPRFSNLYIIYKEFLNLVKLFFILESGSTTAIPAYGRFNFFRSESTELAKKSRIFPAQNFYEWWVKNARLGKPGLELACLGRAQKRRAKKIRSQKLPGRAARPAADPW